MRPENDAFKVNGYLLAFEYRCLSANTAYYMCQFLQYVSTYFTYLVVLQQF